MLLSIRVGCIATLVSSTALASAQPVRGSPLGSEELYSWSIRASHTDELLLATGDSVDIVLLRYRCGADAGHGSKGCWDANTVQVMPRWAVSRSDVAQVRSLPSGAWRFGPGAAGARVYARRPGAAIVTARLQDGQRVSDSVWVIAASGAVRILLEPKPSSIVSGDTVRFRVTARDAANRIVAVVPLSHGWNLVGPPDSAGFTPVAFVAGQTGGVLVARLGRLTDSLPLHFMPRPKHER
jgi:hypothetical protein